MAAALMKLTLAMGLQFDNGKSSQMYALALGHGQGKLQPVQNNPAMALDGANDPLPTISSTGNDALFILTYSLQGLPVLLIQDSTRINLFA